MIGIHSRDRPKSFIPTLNGKSRNSAIGSVFGNSEIWQLTAESADDFDDFGIRMGRRDRPKSFLYTLNGKKSKFGHRVGFRKFGDLAAHGRID